MPELHNYTQGALRDPGLRSETALRLMKAMLLGRVIGTLVACEAYQGLAGVPMLVVQPLTKKCEPKGDAIVCCDSTHMAGPGELVYYEGGREAAMALQETFVPVDHTIVGIVDDLNTT